MPSGKTHAVFSMLAGAGLFYALGGYPRPEALAACAGAMAGIVITPDLDVDNATRAHYVVGRRFGAAGYAAWRAIWLPYGLAIGHRSWVSHFPVVSTLIRLGYLALIGWALWMAIRLAGVVIAVQPPSFSSLPGWWMYAVGGLMASDVLHWAADIISTGIKRRLHRRRPGRKHAVNASE